MYSEDDLLPLSGLQHLLYCERQCALIHVEGLWADNRLTAEGSDLHRKVDSGRGESRKGRRIARSVPIRSLIHGLVGIADVIEFTGAGPDMVAFPIEYKRGRPKSNQMDAVQLCAQALCLEEMLGISVPSGALFYGQRRRRYEISFDHALRSEVATAALRLHALVSEFHTPGAEPGPKCDRCSLRDLCLPELGRPNRSVRHYLDVAILGSDDLPGSYQ